MIRLIFSKKVTNSKVLGHPERKRCYKYATSVCTHSLESHGATRHILYYCRGTDRVSFQNGFVFGTCKLPPKEFLFYPTVDRICAKGVHVGKFPQLTIEAISTPVRWSDSRSGILRSWHAKQNALSSRLKAKTTLDFYIDAHFFPGTSSFSNRSTTIQHKQLSILLSHKGDIYVTIAVMEILMSICYK